jgi:type I restriction enzyme S subunit
MTTVATPNEWREVSLFELCERTELTNPEREPGKPFLYVDVSSVSNEAFQIVGPKEILGRDAPSRARKVIRSNDVIFATVRPSLKRVALVPPALDGQVCSTGFCVLRPKQCSLDPGFLYFYLLTEGIQRKVEGLQDGATYPAIRDSDLLEQRIPLPILPEQRAIAFALNAVQKAKEARQRELVLERERKAALMEYLFTHGTRGEPTKQTEIGEIPGSWRVDGLSDVVAVKGGKRLPKGASFKKTPTGLPYIRVVDFRDGSVRTDDLKFLAPEIQQSIRRYTISRDDVYISIAGTIGLVGTVPEELDGANLTENAAKLVITDKASLDKDFLALILSSECGQRQIQNLTTKTTQPKLALMRIEQIMIPQPSVDEQREIARILRACETKQVGLGKEIMCLDELFRALLDELMTGRLSALPPIEEHQAR